MHREKQLHYPALDGVRGLAVLAVLVWHYAGVDYYNSGIATTSDLALTISLLWGGVTFFFVLSGFLVGGILLDHASSSNLLSTFYLRRGFRIVPLYAVTLATLFIAGSKWLGLRAVVPHLFEPELPWWSFVVFMQNIAMVLQRTMGGEWISVTWSLAVEEHFYAILPIMVLLLRGRPRLFVAASLALMATALALRAGMSGGYPLMPWHSDALFGGVLVAMAKRNHLLWLRIKSLDPRFVLSAFLLICAVGFSLAKHGCHMGHWALQGLMALAGMTLICGLLAHRETWWAKLFENRALRYAGTISYGVYLFHQSVAGLVFGFTLGTKMQCRDVSSFFACLGAASLTLVLSHFAYRIIENPCIRFARRWGYA